MTSDDMRIIDETLRCVRMASTIGVEMILTEPQIAHEQLLVAMRLSDKMSLHACRTAREMLGFLAGLKAATDTSRSTPAR